MVVDAARKVDVVQVSLANHAESAAIAAVGAQGDCVRLGLLCGCVGLATLVL